MNPLTRQFITNLWSSASSFEEVGRRFPKECKRLSPVEAAIIGKDLILRKLSLFEKDFKLAAFLASDGVAGNDGFLDFVDCVSLLPEERFERVSREPDTLIDDPVSEQFEELYMVSSICEVFDKAMIKSAKRKQYDDGILEYLVGREEDELDWDLIQSGTIADAKERLPRLYAKYGNLLEVREETVPESDEDSGSRVTLEDFTGSTFSLDDL